MKYSSYPSVDDPSIPEGEREIQEHLLLIEQIQRDLWGGPINDGSILKPSNPHLMMNWIAGGIFQYQPNGPVVSSTYALSRPDEDPYVDDDGIKWSGIGFEYFTETEGSQDWAIGLLISIASNIYSEQSTMPFPGMFINANSGFIPPELNPKMIHLLCIKRHEVAMPDGRCDYVQFVPMDELQLSGYMALGDEKAEKASDWYLSKGYDTCIRL